MLLAFVLALGGNAGPADAQAFKARSKTGLPKRPAITAVATAPATPAAATAKAPAPRKVVTPARPVAVKKAATGKKGKGGDDDDVVVVDDEEDEE